MGETLLSHIILKSPLRDYFIKKVKLPLMKALILIGKRIPEVTKENTLSKNAHTFSDIFDKFEKHYKIGGERLEMFKASRKIFLMEIDHDILYGDPFLWFIEETIKAILRGDIEERTNGHPMMPWWDEEPPYGGKYSIIRILQNKQSLEKVMGDDWKYKGN